jgi:CheY-like chemotaxis protein
LVLQVSDTGIGISEEAQRRLFQPFVQADSGTTRQYGGTGLGLVICKRRVELMGGSLTLESVLKEGMTFTASFPLALVDKIEVGQLSPHKTPPDDLLVGKRVLLVDDNPINLRVAKAMLEGMGIIVTIAENAEDAKRLLQSRTNASSSGFDGMILDAMMPVVDGWELGQWVRSFPHSKHAPLILASSAIADDTQLAGESDLFDVVLPKPLRRSTLFRSLAISLTGWRPTRPTLPSSDVQPRRVLVVEDSLVNQLVTKSFLTNQGHEVTIAENGQMALEMISGPDAFDLILMDVQMPVLDGLQATRQLRERETKHGWLRMPVLALTGNVMQEEKEACLAAGMDGCLTKPLTMSEVQAFVAETPIRRPA